MADEAAKRELETLAVLAQYGRTMLAVQTFEMDLALLAVAIEIDPARPSKTDLRRELRRALKPMIHAVHRASASDLRKRLEGHFPPAFLDELESAVRWRNYLAHRFLRDRLIRSPSRRFREGSLEDLVSLTRSFQSTDARLWRELDRVRASWPAFGADLPTEVRDALTEIARSVMRGTPLPRRPQD